MSEAAPEKKIPVVTYTVIGLCVLVYLWELSNFNAVFRALIAPFVLPNFTGAWALFTMTLVHSPPPNYAHLIFNMMAFRVLGKITEIIFGPFRLAILMIALAWVSSAAQIDFDNYGIGLSGVIYGIFGFMLGASPRSQYLRWFVKQNALMLIGWAVFCVVATQLGWLRIGNWAHFGGLIYGGICGLIYGLPRYRYALIGLAIVIPIALAALLPAAIDRILAQQ